MSRVFRGLRVVVAASLLCAGCATVFSGTTQRIEVFTEPSGATVTAGDQQIVTPGVLKLRRKEKNLEVRIELAGYESRTIALSRKQNGLVWLNMVGVPAGVIGGLSATQDQDSWFGEPAAAVGAGAGLSGLGFGIDYSTGAAYKLDPAKIVVKLEPALTAAAR